MLANSLGVLGTARLEKITDGSFSNILVFFNRAGHGKNCKDAVSYIKESTNEGA